MLKIYKVVRKRLKYAPFVVVFIVLLGIFDFSENLVAPKFGTCISIISAEQTANGSNKHGFIVNLTVRQAICSVALVDRHNGFFALIVAFVIACFTYTLRQASIDQGRQTERSLRISEDSLTIAKWPYLYIKDPVFITPLGGSRASSPPVFEYWMVVFGESPAVIRRLYQKLAFSVDIPTAADEREHNWETPDWFIKQGDGWQRQASPIDMSDGARAAWSSPQSANKKYYFVGCVIYDDVFGNQHELGFCYWAPRAGGAGIKCGGTEYNYSRRYEGNKI